MGDGTTYEMFKEPIMTVGAFLGDGLPADGFSFSTNKEVTL